MASKNEQSRKPTPAAKPAKGRGELESKDLDKVTGGMASRPGTIGTKGEPYIGG
jgi:hypothetical protein